MDEADGSEYDRLFLRPLKGKTMLIDNRDPLFTKKFREILKAAGVSCKKLPPRSPNLNAYAERFVRSNKYECLNKMIFFSEKQLRYVVDQYIEHYNVERPHQGIGNVPTTPAPRKKNHPASERCIAKTDSVVCSSITTESSLIETRH